MSYIRTRVHTRVDKKGPIRRVYDVAPDCWGDDWRRLNTLSREQEQHAYFQALLAKWDKILEGMSIFS